MKGFVNAPIYIDGAGIATASMAFDTHIAAIGRSVMPETVIPVPSGCVVLPGFIDEHIHGAGGFDTMDATEEAIGTVANTLPKEGVTAFLATTMTGEPSRIAKAVKAVGRYQKTQQDGAVCLGVHLEGPFISPQYAGAQPIEYIQTPCKEMFTDLYRAGNKCVRMMTLAPEEDKDGLIAYATSLGVRCHVGHSNATEKEVAQGMEAGLSGVTHTFNASRPFHHREIGVGGCALYYDGLVAEVIADGIHVAPAAIGMLYKSKPKDGVILVTDAMRQKGLTDGESELGGQTVIVKNGEARLLDGTLAGSVLTMNRAIECLVHTVGIPFTDAVDCCTLNPAKHLGLDREMGSIQVGKMANFTVLNPGTFEVVTTVINGEIAYQNPKYCK